MLRRLIAAALFLFIAAPALSAQTATVLVFPFENQSNDRNLDWIGEGIAELIVTRLQADPGLYVFSRDERLAGFDRMGIPEGASVSRATAMHLGWSLGADSLIAGRFTGGPDDFCIYARVINLETSAAGPEISSSGKLEDIISIANTSSWLLLKTLVPSNSAPESDYTSRPPVPRSAFENYVRGILAPDPQRRTDYLEKAIRLYPQYDEASFQLGRFQHAEGDFKNSSLHLQKIGKNSPDYRQAQFLIGLNQCHLEDYAHAAAIFTSLPQSYDVLIDLGDALVGKGDTAGAFAAWRRALEKDPLSPDAAFNIGYVSLNKGDADTAIKMLEQSLKMQGRDPEAMFLLARAYERAGRIEESQKTMSQAARLSARVERWQTQPPTKLERLHDLQDPLPLRAADSFQLWSAERAARRARSRDLAVWVESVQSDIDSQQYGVATRELHDMMAVYPQSADARLLLAQVYSEQKNYDGAVTEIERAIGLRPSVEAYMQLARTYRSLNQLSSAYQAVQQALQLEPNHAAALALKAEIQRQIRQNSPARTRPHA